MSWLLPCCRSTPPLTAGRRLGEVWLSGRGASSSPSLLLLSSPLPEALAESEELLLPLLLICSMTSTSALSSVGIESVGLKFPFNPSPLHRDPGRIVSLLMFGNELTDVCGWTSSPLLMSSSCGSGEGLSFVWEGDVLIPVPGLVGALN